MRINKVTITGADDKVRHEDLATLSKKYPFVEWGILFSKARRGTNRYPTEAWVDKLAKYNLQLSAHFCGQYAKEVINDSNFKEIEGLKGFSRVQLNYNFAKTSGWYLPAMTAVGILKYAADHPEMSFIFQYNKSNESVLDIIIKISARNIHMLYDSSGGRGTEISELKPPITSFYTGYAGGISDTNVSEICTGLTLFPKILYKEEDVWIDLESGARTGDEFDLKKVESILRQCANFIKI